MIFNIQRCSVHDGDGLRTLVFFKGCPMRCVWCANPESQRYEVEIMESPGKCIGCGACIRACPNDAIALGKDGPRIDRMQCSRCLKCTESCYAAAKYQVGKLYEPEMLLAEIAKDKPFYAIKGGGVTFSGGEPLTHGPYLEKIAKLCRADEIDVAVESCGIGDWDQFKGALPYINSMFLDIKHIDSEQHRRLTGFGNEKILENIRRIAAVPIHVTVRTPIVPGYNDDRENILGIAEFIRSLPSIKSYELLAYHKLGVNKYAALGRAYALADVEPPSDAQMLALVREVNHVFRDTDQVCFFTKDNERLMG